MDPMVRIFQEKAMEAIYDAGFHPSELEGTKTGVYVGVITNENDKSSYFDNNLSSQTFAVTGCVVFSAKKPQIKLYIKV